MPRASVVMACFNGMPYLPMAVDSILQQSCKDWELIVVDDGSTDASPEYLEKVASSDDRVRVLRQANAGQQAAANAGIKLARGEFIVRMDADDVTTLDRIEKQIEFMDRHPEVVLLGGQIRRMGNQGSGMPSNLPLEHEEIVSGLLKNQHVMCNGTTLFRRETFDQTGGYWKYNIAEDWDMFLRLSDLGKLANLPDLLLTYRLHCGSINGRRIVEAQLYNEYAAYLCLCRRAGKSEPPFEQFFKQHRSRRWPASWGFYLDSLAIGQYREAIAEIYDGKPFRGYCRMTMAMAMAPSRTLRRLANGLFVRGTGHASPT